jgi:hypothetical protein
VAVITYHPSARGKGVQRTEYTHAHLLANVLAAEVHNPVHFNEKSLSFVPWCEGSGLVHELLAFMRKGAKVYACEGRLRMRYNCQELGPTVVHSRADCFKVFFFVVGYLDAMVSFALMLGLFALWLEVSVGMFQAASDALTDSRCSNKASSATPPTKRSPPPLSPLLYFSPLPIFLPPLTLTPHTHSPPPKVLPSSVPPSRIPPPPPLTLAHKHVK